MWCQVRFDIFNHLRVDNECDRHTDRQTDGQTEPALLATARSDDPRKKNAALISKKVNSAARG